MSTTINNFKGVYSFLSNFDYSPIMLRGWEFDSVEHAFQAYKMTNVENAIKVRDAHSPGQAKRIARTLPMRSDWDQIKEQVMLDCLRLKFSNINYKLKLQATGKANLIEGNDWGDVYWGVCNGKGRNRLGVLLMQVRDEINAKRS